MYFPSSLLGQIRGIFVALWQTQAEGLILPKTAACTWAYGTHHFCTNQRVKCLAQAVWFQAQDWGSGDSSDPNVHLQIRMLCKWKWSFQTRGQPSPEDVCTTTYSSNAWVCYVCQTFLMFLSGIEQGISIKIPSLCSCENQSPILHNLLIFKNPFSLFFVETHRCQQALLLPQSVIITAITNNLYGLELDVIFQS